MTLEISSQERLLHSKKCDEFCLVSRCTYKWALKNDTHKFRWKTLNFTEMVSLSFITLLKNSIMRLVRRCTLYYCRYLKDFFTSMIDLAWSWTLLSFCASFYVSWLVFSLVWSDSRSRYLAHTLIYLKNCYKTANFSSFMNQKVFISSTYFYLNPRTSLPESASS